MPVSEIDQALVDRVLRYAADRGHFLPKDGTECAIAETLAALRESGRLVEWRPIETAPRDGTWILGWAERDSSPYRVSWGRNHLDALAWCTTFGSFIDGYITHWQPLQVPPTTAATEGE